jgi:hypothetical protein
MAEDGVKTCQPQKFEYRDHTGDVQIHAIGNIQQHPILIWPFIIHLFASHCKVILSQTFWHLAFLLYSIIFPRFQILKRMIHAN